MGGRPYSPNSERHPLGPFHRFTSAHLHMMIGIFPFTSRVSDPRFGESQVGKVGRRRSYVGLDFTFAPDPLIISPEVLDR